MKINNLKSFILSLFILCTLYNSIALADGIVVDKVYHPYVLPNEREVEWRLLSQKRENDHSLGQRLAYGHSLTDNLMVELYVVVDRDDKDIFELQSYEAELRWMLTEQGEYWADWGVLFEFERNQVVESWEVTSGLIVEKEFGRTSLTMNMLLIYEWGNTIVNEIESEFRLQYRYRWMPQIQPAIELYSGENYIGIGPAFMGIQRFDGQKQLKWEAGFITKLSGDNKDHILRVSIEYEF